MATKKQDDDWNKPLTERERIAIMYADPENAMRAHEAEQDLDHLEKTGKPRKRIIKDGRTAEQKIEDLVNQVGGG